MADKKYDDYESSSGGSDSDNDDDGADLKYISKVKKAAGVAQVGGVGDYDDDENMEEISDDDDDVDEGSWESGSNNDDELFEKKPGAQFIGDDDEDELELSDEDDDEETKLQKFNDEVRKNVITEHHPELMIHNYHEVEAMCTIVRNERGIIIDPLHKTLPFITKYEKAKILGERAKQINAGAKPFVVVSDEILDGYVIALMEFEHKKIPMIIRRPLPNNGCEYWRVADLENIL